ncbi:MAG TPA: class I SAM-dependent methyltransferase [Gemmatimonadaceae bacterium]|nr:class I SAM-dependent methyltransferase [Gemmatimonadaceae bacterium]
MFSASAELYDLIYAGIKDYGAEARAIAAIVRAAHPGARTLLDVACGTGEHARLLAAEHGFTVEGLDLEPGFLRIAREKLGADAVHQGDMERFALPRRYDVVACLFSSIGYLRTLDAVQRALERFRAHLAPGGIVLVEPWFPPDVLEDGRVRVDTAAGEGVTVARLAHTAVEGRLSRLRFEYLIGRRAGIEHAVELHELGLFTTEELLACFAAAGLRATHDPAGPSGRGLFVARATTSIDQP